MDMNKRISTILVCATLCATAMAVPAEPGVHKITNPDGSVVEVMCFGDERFSFLTDSEGQRILERDSRGFVVEAVREGRQLKASNAADIERLRAEEGQRRLPPLDDMGRSTFPTTGCVKGVVVLLNYSDTKFSIDDPVGTITKMCNEPGYDLYGSRGSVKDYFHDSSNGKFDPSFDVYGPVELPETSEYYTGGYRAQKFHEAAGYAIKALDDEVDFTQYDYDGDGVVDNVFFFFAGHGQNDTYDTTRVWPHQDDYRRYVNSGKVDAVSVDGKEFATYACSCELKGSLPKGAEEPWLDGIGVFVHEFGHVFGLPDLYDTGVVFIPTRSPGKWSVMDTGEYNGYAACPPRYSAYEQWFCHWLEMEDMKEGERYELRTMSDTDTPRALSQRVPKSAGSNDYHNEWFFFETRTNDNWDSALDEEGLVIWRVNFDADKWASNKVNVNSKPCVELIQPNRSKNHYTWPGSERQYNFICPGVGTSLTPANTSHNFSMLIDDIRLNLETKSVSFGYNCVERGDEVTEFDDLVVVDHELRNFTIRWKPVEGATDYLLTVNCYDEDNWLRVVNYWDSSSTGGATEVTLENLMEKFWKFEMTCNVRVVKGVPSTKMCAPLVFTPADIDMSGLDNVAGNIGIFGFKGGISAPEGAKVYDLQGRPRSATGLERGMYVVVCDGRATKVTVQ